MKKRILLLTAAFIAIAIGVVGMSAFEAHVINVTAKIENALSASTYAIEFGTVFPEEYLVERIDIGLSESFMESERVDDIQYILKQKPKPRYEPDRPLTPIKPDYRMYLPDGQLYPALYPNWIDNDTQRGVYCHTHAPADPGDPSDLYYINCYPDLCPYLSKTDADPEDNNDGPDIPVLHDPGITLLGYLAKSVGDIIDLWDIDLLVPCFSGQCAQDDIIPEEFELDPRLNSSVFGCDLWFEVTGISLSPLCGNDYIDPNEECELPNTTNNTNCPQDTTECVGPKLQTRDEYGDCDAGCGCIEDPFENPQCNIAQCSAGCESDGDCDDSNPATTDTCNLDTCQCEYDNPDVCGDGDIDSGETCELPNSTDNSFCTQTTEECVGPKLQTRDGFGDCDAVCGCIDDPFENPVCSISECSAGCESDGDCDDSDPGTADTCNLDTCSCEYETLCGNGEPDPGEECDDGNDVSGDGCENDCTISPTITVIKQMNNIHGGNEDADDFTLYVVDGGITAVSDGVPEYFAPGSYDITESGPDGYQPSFSGNCDIDGHLVLSAGEDLTCTITNTDIAPSIKLVKVVSVGGAQPTEFTMRVNGTVVPSGFNYVTTSNAAHTITEDAKAGYNFVSMSGTGDRGSICPGSLGGTVTLLEGEKITCTITNAAD